MMRRALVLTLLLVFATGCDEDVRQAAEQGNADAQFRLALAYSSDADSDGVPKDDHKAVQWFRKAAEQGHADAQFLLGVFSGSGERMPENDHEAVKWFRMAAEQGHADAQFELGKMLTRGEGVPKDDREAEEWFRMASEQGRFDYAQHALESAEQGDAFNQFVIGKLYLSGEGVPKDDREALKWFRKAAEQGESEAQFVLGEIYAGGYGLPKDDVLAYLWFSLAASNSREESLSEWADISLELVAGNMTPDEIAEAQRLAREWWAKHEEQ